jgi:hypothetical protein
MSFSYLQPAPPYRALQERGHQSRFSTIPALARAPTARARLMLVPAGADAHPGCALAFTQDGCHAQGRRSHTAAQGRLGQQDRGQQAHREHRTQEGRGASQGSRNAISRKVEHLIHNKDGTIGAQQLKRRRAGSAVLRVHGLAVGDVDRRTGDRAGLIRGGEGGHVADVVERRGPLPASSRPRSAR